MNTFKLAGYLLALGKPANKALPLGLKFRYYSRLEKFGKKKKKKKIEDLDASNFIKVAGYSYHSGWIRNLRLSKKKKKKKGTHL